MPRMDKIGTTSTTVEVIGDTTTVTYHRTPVVTFNVSEICLNTGGWSTQTTRNRMNQTSNQFGLEFGVYQRNFEFWVSYQGCKIPFGDSDFLRLHRKSGFAVKYLAKLEKVKIREAKNAIRNKEEQDRFARKVERERKKADTHFYVGDYLFPKSPYIEDVTSLRPDQNNEATQGASILLGNKSTVTVIPCNSTWSKEAVLFDLQIKGSEACILQSLHDMDCRHLSVIRAISAEKVKYYIQKVGRKHKKTIATLSSEAMERSVQFPFGKNVE